MGRSKFLRIKCKCGNEQVTFSHATTQVNCLVCGSGLGTPTGSRLALHCKVVQVL